MKSCILLSISCLASVLTFSLSAALTSQSYSQNGLIGQWDGIENAGVGQHDATATTWIELTGGTNNFTLTSGVASFTANGLHKDAQGIMAKSAYPGTRVRAVEVVVSGVPSSGWANALFISKNQTVSINNSSTGGKRGYFFDDKHYGCLTDQKPDGETVAVNFNGGCDAVKDDNSYFSNGAKPDGTSAPNNWGGASDLLIYLGGRSGQTNGGDYKTTGYTIHAIRLYNRELTSAEIVRHASIDQVRFFGAPEGIVGSSTYAIGATAGVGGLVSFDDVSAAPAQTATSESFANGKSFSVALRAVPLPGWKFREWSGDFTYVTAGNATTPGLVVKAACGRGYHATFERTAEDGLAYITNGLVGLWDGIENAGEGLHDAAATVWKDLSGNAGDFIVQPAIASFTENGLKKISAPGCCATNVVNHTGVWTVEGAVSGANRVLATDAGLNQWVHLVYMSKDQTLTMRNKSTGSEFFFDYENLKWTMDTQWDELTMTARYELKDNRVRGTSFLLDGAPAANGSKPTWSGMYWGDNARESLGGRWNASGSSDAKIYGYTIHALRMYDRVLSDAEAAYNAAVDQRRFHGRREAGFAYRLVDGVVQRQLRAWTDGLGGRVGMPDGAPSGTSVATGWSAAGTEQTATFVAEPEKGWAFLGWQGDVGAIVTGAPTDRTVTVRSNNGVALQAVFTQTMKYVRNGLVGCWDALENAGYGRHDANASVWTDLTGQSGDFQVNAAAGGFTANALAKTATGRLAFNPVRQTAAITVEAVLSALPENAWALPIYIGLNKNISIKDKGAGGLRYYFYNSWTDGLKTPESPSEMTVAVRFEDAQRTLFVNGVTPAGESYQDSFGDTADGLMTLGGRKNTEGASDALAFGYRIHAIRLYDRALTPSELSRNARRDAIRYFGAPEPGTAIIIR